MADVKISALTSATTPLAGTEVAPIVQSGTTKKVSVENIVKSTQPNSVANTIPYLNGSKVPTNGTQLQFDGNNIGVNVTPNARSNGKAIEVGTSGNGVSSDFGNTYLTNNWYYNSGDFFAGTGYAVNMYQEPSTGKTVWRCSSASGTAGNPATMFTLSVLDRTGSVGIGSGLAIGSTTPPGALFAIAGSVMSSGAGTHFLKWSNVTGTVTYDTSSRLVKTDIEDSKYGLAEILKLRPRKYYRTDDQKIEHGLIADEVVDTMPEFVPMVPKSLLTKNEEDTELVPGGVNYERLVAPLINAIHELNAQVEMLKSKLGE